MGRSGYGARELRMIARDLRVAGTPSVGLRKKLRKEILASVQPMKAQVKANARAIETRGTKSTGLRGRLARATRTNIRVAGVNTRVRLMVDGKKMPGNQTKLPAYMEGSDGRRRAAWRHPTYGHDDRWVDQASHPYFAPAIPPHLPGVQAAVLSAIDRTRSELLD